MTAPENNINNVRVSIVVPMYNAAKYIIETLESVRSQTYKNWELFVVDDGSSDASADIVNEYFSQHQGMGLLLSHPQKKNRGTSSSRNLGMEHANGELLCFLDADDVWDHNFLDSLIQVFEEYPQVSMAYCPALLWHTHQNRAKDKIQRLGIKANRIVDSFLLFKLFLIGHADTPSPSGIMIRRQALAEAGGWEVMFRDMYDDQVLYSKLLLNGINVYVKDECLYRYRQHDESLCHIAEKEKREPKSRKIYLEWLNQYLLEKGELSEDISVILTEHLWYVQRRIDIDSLSLDGWWSRKFSSLRSLIILFALQKNISTVIKLSFRMVCNQVLHAVRKL